MSKTLLMEARPKEPLTDRLDYAVRLIYVYGGITEAEHSEVLRRLRASLDRQEVK